MSSGSRIHGRPDDWLNDRGPEVMRASMRYSAMGVRRRRNGALVAAAVVSASSLRGRLPFWTEDDGRVRDRCSCWGDGEGGWTVFGADSAAGCKG